MKRYLAFISYRHLPDSNDAALGIRKGLEGYHLPKNCPLPKRRRVFRDTDELPTSSDLGMDIENALRDSEYLIALCSEDYLQSKWCLREVEIYIESGRKDRILPVLLSGTPETSVPTEIRDLPVAADLRADAPGRPYDKKKVRPAIPELLAVMSDMDPDRISGAEFKFRAGVAAGAAACLAAGLMGFALYASYTADRIADNNTRIAEAAEQTAREEKQALQERDSALLRQSEYLAEQAWEALKEEDINEAIRLALSALPDDLHGDLPVSPEAEGVLRVALSMEMPPSYHLSYTAETDYDIRGYYIYPYIDDRTFLTTDRFGIGQPYVDYFGETGVVETAFSESRQQAMDLGYTHLLHLAGEVNARRHYYYGPGRQMYSENTGGSYHVDYTLDGEPFCAAGAVLDPEYGGVVAWEGPGEGREPRTVLLGGSGAEPTAILDIEGVPVSVGFSTNATFICLVDEAGTLHIYDNKGVLQKKMEGDYTDVIYYYDNGPCAAAGSLDGTVTILDLDNFQEILRFSCPSAVRQLRVNKERSCFLVRCDSGVYLYHFLTGNYITEIGSGAVPNYAIWKNDEGSSGADPNMILLIYDRRIELYAIDTDIDTSVTDYHPLFSEGVPKGYDMIYSQDGKRIYQHTHTHNLYVYEPGEDMMYCWDAFTGKLLWENANPCTCYGSIRTLSADGSSLWRVFEGRDETAVQKIDGRTGEVLLSALWPGEFWEPMADQPMESPDGTRAFLTMQMSSTSSLNRTEMLLVFDTRTGELLWRLDLDKDSQEWREANEAGSFLTTEQLREAGRVLPEERKGFVQAAFSKDGKYIYCVQNVIRKETKDPGVCVDRLDAETGKIMEEICLPLADQKIKLWEEEEAFVLVDQKHNEVNTSDLSVYSNDEWAYPSYAGAVRDVTVEHTVRIFDLAKWDYTAEIPFTYLRSPEAHNQTLAAVRSLDGGMALIWETENGDGDGEEFCCRLEKDGSLGPVCEAESEAGRRLWVAKDQYISFMGQVAFLQNGRLYRLSDGVLLLQSAWNASLQVIQDGTGVLFTEGSNVERGIKASKDGTSICMYSSYAGTTRTPFLVLPSDLDTLVEKGRRRIGAD